MSVRPSASPSPWVVLLAAVVLAVGTAGSASAKPLQIDTPRLPAGAAVLRVAPRSTGVASLVVSFQVGSFDDDTQPGRTRLCQWLLLMSNDRLDYRAFRKELAGTGAQLELQTRAHSSAFVLTAPARDFDRLSKKLVSALLKPKVTSKRFEQAVRKTLQDEIVPGAIGGLTESVLRTVLESPGYQSPRHGERSAIEGITGADAALQLRHFRPANATVVVAGPVKTKAWKKRIAAFRGGKARAKLPPIKARAEQVDVTAYFEAHVLGYAIESNDAQTLASFLIAERALAEGVFWGLREEGLTYGAGSRVLSLPRQRWLIVEVVSNPLRASDAHRLLPRAIESALDPVQGPVDFPLAKQLALAKFDRIDQDAERLAERLTFDAPLHQRKVRKAIEAQDAATFRNFRNRDLADQGRFWVHFSMESR